MSLSIPLVGLINDNSLCYLNSLLQCLFSCEKFNNFVLTTKFDEHNINSYKSLLSGIIKHFQATNKIFKVNPVGFKSSFFNHNKMIRGMQQDADESLVYFLDNITDKNNYFFKNILRTYTKCDSCGEIATKDDEVYQIYLNPTNLSLYDCINNYIKPEELSDYKCEKCEIVGKTKKAILPIKFGKYVTFVLKQYSNTYKKLIMELDEEINLGNYLFTKDNVPNKCTIKYKLKGIILHYGGMLGGHYNAICKRYKEWYLIDDDSINKVNQIRVLNNVYMLFYEVEGVSFKDTLASSSESSESL